MATDRPTEAEVRELLEHFEHCREPNGGTVRRFGRALLEAWERERALAVVESGPHVVGKSLHQQMRDDVELQRLEARADAAEKRADEMRRLLERAALFIEQQCTDGPICGAAESTGEDIVAQALAHLAGTASPTESAALREARRLLEHLATDTTVSYRSHAQAWLAAHPTPESED